MLKDCIKLNEKQKKFLLVVVCAILVLLLLSFIEPGYKQICADKKYPGPENCASYNAVAYFFIRASDVLNAISPVLTALATIVIGIFTWTLWRSTDRSGEHFRVSERAYVKVSPFEPGVRWDNQTGGGFTVSYRIKNFGSTPATVTDVISNAIVVPNNMCFDEIPHNVRHDFPKETRTFLVKDDEFFQHPHTSIDDAERAIVENGDQRLIVYGYADYIDQFGVRHRAGFGRQYLPNTKALNLVFPDTGLFNYDRVRSPREGIDWDG